ncbi:hypothetical protein CI109_103043 [Kwoniella shandongensis]|uniref:Uncharacterized protein n=1 Tax=Kwoniella shandongensis TaxID=1734106 RepID=A0A5M6C8Q2_9TREE|nr:uncharacterized protein CI109_000234 [Kwoniella shandongensis]KAA5531393.1 hypothetical protein CI109_000234 [Kwoniella shandongensis]
MLKLWPLLTILGTPLLVKGAPGVKMYYPSQPFTEITTIPARPTQAPSVLDKRVINVLNISPSPTNLESTSMTLTAASDSSASDTDENGTPAPDSDSTSSSSTDDSAQSNSSSGVTSMPTSTGSSASDSDTSSSGGTVSTSSEEAQESDSATASSTDISDVFSNTASTTISSSGTAIATSIADGSDSYTVNSTTIFGAGGVANCSLLHSNTGADWLISAACAMMKCNPKWIEANLKVIEAGAYTVQITTYDEQYNAHHTEVTYANATRDTSDNANGAWIGGTIDRGVENMGGLGVNNNQLLNQTQWEEHNGGGSYLAAGLMGLQYLTGWYPTYDLVPDDDKLLSSPLIAMTPPKKFNLGQLASSQYYTVSHFESDTNNTVVWDPYGQGDSAYHTLGLDDFRRSFLGLYHLDWPHFFHANQDGGSQ